MYFSVFEGPMHRDQLAYQIIWFNFVISISVVKYFAGNLIDALSII